jgi:hypothetical protein
MKQTGVLVVSWVKTISGQIVKYRRPEEQDQHQPEIFFVLLIEASNENVPKDDKHQTDIYDKSQQTDWDKSIYKAQLGEK